MSNQQTKWVLRIYERLLALYPIEYRDQYREDMIATFSDLADDTFEQQGMLGLSFLLFHSALDIFSYSLKEHFHKHKKGGEYMAQFSPSSPVRGFRTLFWVILFLALGLNYFNGRFPTDLLFLALVGIYLIGLVFLLLRSKRQLGIALGVVGFCLGAGILFSITYDSSILSDMSWLMKYFNPTTGGEISGIVVIIQNISVVLPFLLLGYLVVAEMEKPRLGFLWKRLQHFMQSQPQNIVRCYQWLVWSTATMAFILLIALPWSLFRGNQGVPEEGLTALSDLFGFFYSSGEGIIVLFLGFLVVIWTGLSLWSLSKKNLKKTIAGIFLTSFTLIASNLLSFNLTIPSVYNRPLNTQETAELVRACPGIDQPANYAVPPTPLPNACSAYMDLQRVGNTVYSGLSMSTEPTTGKSSNFERTAFDLPLIAHISENPVFLLVAAGVIAFYLPAFLLTFFIKRARGKSPS